MQHSNIRLLKRLSFFDGLVLYAPVLIIYFQQITHSYASAGGLLALATIASAIAEVPTGVLSDRIGRRNTARLGATSRVLAVAAYALGALVGPIGLIVGSVLDGVASALYSGNNDALLHDSLRLEGKAADYKIYTGQVQSQMYLAYGIAGLVGGAIAFVSIPLAVALTILPKVVALAYAWRLENVYAYEHVVSPYRHLRLAAREFVHNAQLRYLTIGTLISYSLSETTFQMRSVFVSGLWPLWAIGISGTLSQFGASLGAHYSGRIVRRLGYRISILAPDITSKLVQFTAFLINNAASPLLLALPSLSQGISSTAKASLFHANFTNEQRATMWSLSSLLNNIGYGLCVVLAGFLADRIGMRETLMLFMAMTLVGTFFTSLALRHRSKN